jgi:RNA polymerase sigma-70 factor, ECF subfamily
MCPDSENVTTLLMDWRNGSQEAGNQLLATVYRELKRIAGAHLRRERPGHTLDPTALVNELYLRLLSGEPVNAQNRLHFFALAAHKLRQILVDHARRRTTEKRGGGRMIVTLTAAEGWSAGPSNDLLEIDEALAELQTLDERAARVVELKFFGGLHEEEIAQILGVSKNTVQRDWQVARAWLMRQLSGSG